MAAIVAEQHVIEYLKKFFPEAQVTIGIDQTVLERETVIIIQASPTPIGDNRRGALWTVDITVLDVDRTRGAQVVAECIERLYEGVSDGSLPFAGMKTIALPEFVAHNTASQSHTACTASVRFSGHYG